MSWLKKRPISSGIVLAMGFSLSACGVKGDPLPPEKPPELGRGRPTYKRATEDIMIEKHRREQRPADKSEDSDDDKE